MAYLHFYRFITSNVPSNSKQIGIDVLPLSSLHTKFQIHTFCRYTTQKNCINNNNNDDDELLVN